MQTMIFFISIPFERRSGSIFRRGSLRIESGLVHLTARRSQLEREFDFQRYSPLRVAGAQLCEILQGRAQLCWRRCALFGRAAQNTGMAVRRKRQLGMDLK